MVPAQFLLNTFHVGFIQLHLLSIVDLELGADLPRLGEHEPSVLALLGALI